MIEINPAEWILATLSSTSDLAYAGNKMAVVDKVGYADFPMVGHFNITTKDIDELVLHEIGLVENVPFSDFKLYDERFGIKSLEPVQSHTHGRVRISQEGKKCALCLQSVNGEEFTLPAKAWVPLSARPGDKEFRSRVEAGHLRLILAGDPKNEQFTITEDTTNAYPFIDQLGFLTFGKWRSEGEVKAKLLTDIGELSEIVFQHNPESDPWIGQLWHCARFAYNVLGTEKCSEIEISIRELFESLKDQIYISSFMTTNSIRLNGSFESPLEEFNKLVGFCCGTLLIGASVLL